MKFQVHFKGVALDAEPLRDLQRLEVRAQAADIRPRDPQQFQRLVDFLKAHQLTDQLLTGNGWLHLSWSPFTNPRHYIRIGYYK